MAKPTGFLEIKRKDAKYRPVKERIKDYKNVVEYLSYDDVREQASRCMDCGVPFCHCIGCSVENLIPEWNDLVYKGKWKEALERLENTNSLPEITGRVCPATCEASCTLSINDNPVAIKQIELAIIEYGFKQGWIKPKIPGAKIDKKVAIIGSGPAGLSAAIVLRELGYKVTVFEKSKAIGGILRYGIPDFKLEKWVIDRRIDIMKKSGIKFETGVNIGEDMSEHYLRRSFDTILLTIGAGQPRDLTVPGRQLQGIHFAMDYLMCSNKYVSGDIKKDVPINAKGKNVLVIGAGDTGSDCIGTANRQGAKKVYQFEILQKPEEWKESYNPNWPDWPLILRTTSSHKEGVERDWSITTKKFMGKNNQVQEIHCSRVEWKSSEKGLRPQMVEAQGSDFTIKVDLVILATGFVHVEHNKLLKKLKIEYDQCGNIKTDINYTTNVEGIFAAGDSNVGASLVVRAIYDGQQVAMKMHGFLNSLNSSKK
ncbi:glutamate synthase subunit beta [Elusimicrobiota bacterium]